MKIFSEKKTDGAEIKYSVCYQPQGKMSLQVALFRRMQRYWVERAFQNVKEQLGLHQYQVRSWKAWHHHIALTLRHFKRQVDLDRFSKVPK
jgi:SRSO17 transposase